MRELFGFESTANFFGFRFVEELQDFRIGHFAKIDDNFFTRTAKSSLRFWGHLIPIFVAGIFNSDINFFHVSPIFGEVILH